MCGIVGYSGIENEHFLNRMNKVQSHRGPDESGRYWDHEDHVGMAMRRLAIIDIKDGSQPMLNKDRSVILVFNGEIFNFQELKNELLKKNVSFNTDHSDTEIILKLYEIHGFSVVERLNGMFAFVIYDKKKKILFGARDPFGIKPLYLHSHSKGLAWASELKSLHELPTFTKEIDPIAAEQYLGLQYIPQQRSIFSCVKKLNPGHYFVYKLNEHSLSQHRYYDLPFNENEAQKPFILEEVLYNLRGVFKQSVHRWSLSDVPIACSLSGGVDSAAIVAALARSGQKVKTYTVGFSSDSDREINELDEARMVADMYGTDHHEIMIEVDDLVSVLPNMIWHLDEPYGGGLPSWYVYREIGRDVKVAMTGTGGDELFSNYNKFYTLELQPRFQMALRFRENKPKLSKILAGLSSINNYIRNRFIHDTDEYSLRIRHEREDAPLFWTNPFGIRYPTAHGRGFNERLAAKNTYGLSAGRKILDDTFYEYAKKSLRDRCVAVDLRNQLPDEFLQMTDRFSMAFSLEARTPFLDKELVQFVLKIDSKKRLTPLKPKSLFKKAVKNWLPTGYTQFKKKGFVMPLERWLRGPLRKHAEALFEERSLKKDRIIRPDFYRAFFKPFLEGQLNLTQTIWTVYMFRLWQENWMNR